MNTAVERFLTSCDLSQQAAARLLGVTQPTVSEWLHGGRPVPHQTCADMERLSKGQVLAHEIRDDGRWTRIPDKKWPWHKGGRPALDVTRAAA